MDGRQFDLLSRQLVTGNSRRSALGALGAGACAIGLGRFGLQVGEAAAKCTSIGKKCQSKRGKHPKCCSGAKCKGKKCKCPSGKQNSGGVCATPPTCFPRQQACAEGAQCCSGTCSAVFGCDRAAPGEPCFDDDDCFMNDVCVGFVCQE